ncbi:MAG: hypothetical protein GX234_00490 [Clostridiales bacterium]|nr:hypothetical protein [Clostridiales bacterium]
MMKENKGKRFLMAWTPLAVALISSVLYLILSYIRGFSPYWDAFVRQLSFGPNLTGCLIFPLIFAILASVVRDNSKQCMTAVWIISIVVLVIELVSGVLYYVCSFSFRLEVWLNIFRHVPAYDYVRNLWMCAKVGAANGMIGLLISDLLSLLSVVLIIIFSGKMRKNS